MLFASAFGFGETQTLPFIIIAIMLNSYPIIVVNTVPSMLPRTGGSVGRASGCHAGGREYSTPAGPTFRVLK